MARLNQVLDSDDEFPDLSTLLRPCEYENAPVFERASGKRNESDKSPHKGSKGIIKIAEEKTAVPRNAVRWPSGKKHSSEPLPLGPLEPADVNSQHLPLFKDNLDNATKTSSARQFIRRSPKRTAKLPVDYSKFARRLSDASLSLSDNDSSTDLSGFIVPDSASDEDIFSSKNRIKRFLSRAPSTSKDRQSEKYIPEVLSSPFDEQENPGPIDLTSPKKVTKTSRVICPESPPTFKHPPRLANGPGQFSDLDEPYSRLRFIPPQPNSPSKGKDGPRPVTPPSSPFKPRLESPSKSHCIPPSPHRPSIDAFWSADVINDWNEQYSPKKALTSPRKTRRPLQDDHDELSPSESPRKSPTKSPGKKDKRLIDQRKAFNERKERLATSFLAEVDQAVGGGQVAAMAESTGGIKVIWSKKLSSTAGRANWRREAVRSKIGDGTVLNTVHRHHASIELAEKVIDNEDRLTNVIAHEYCHLANFMISGIKDNPHGASFKSWAAKTTRAFHARNVEVTTKHSYEIAYKYIWVCSSEICGLEYKRHSKSIDPAKHSCGNCKSGLVQVQPAPRKGSAAGKGKRSEYQDFVKKEHERVRLSNPGATFGEIMAILGREYRESKKPAAILEDVEKIPKPVVEEVKSIGGDLIDMASKLGILHLEA